MQGRTQLVASADDFAFFHVNDRSHDLQSGFRASSHPNKLIEGLIVFGPTVWVTGAVFSDSLDKDCLRTQNLAPGSGNGQEVGVAEGNVAGRDVGACQVRLFNRNSEVGQARTADLAQVVQFGDKAMPHLVVICNRFKSLPLSFLSSLAIRNMQEGQRVALVREGSKDKAINSSTDQNKRKLA